MLDDATMSRMTGHQQMDDARGSTRKLTYADFLRFPDDGRRHELIDGERHVSPCPESRHQALSLRLTLALGNYLEAMPIGQLFYAPFDCVISMFDIVEPDLLVILNDQESILTKKNIRGMPALVSRSCRRARARSMNRRNSGSTNARERASIGSSTVTSTAWPCTAAPAGISVSQ